MAVLPVLDRTRVWAHFMRTSKEPAAPGFTKADLQAAVDATDTWIDTNSNAYNLALPVAFRNGATQLAKTLLFCYVAMRRAGVLKTADD